MKVIIYTRVSTEEQSASNQLPALEKWASDRGHEIVGIYSENETAWRSGHQSELARLFHDLPKRKPEIALVWSLDRLTREGIARIFELVNRFKAHNVQVASLQEPWTEQAGPMADLLYAVTAWVAEFESSRRSERTKAGLERVKRAGGKLGRPAGSRDKKQRKTRGYHLRYDTK